MNPGASVGSVTGVGFGQPLHSATKLAAIVEALIAEGIPTKEALRGVHVRMDELELSGDPYLAKSND